MLSLVPNQGTESALSLVPWYGRYTRALTFENVCYALQAQILKKSSLQCFYIANVLGSDFWECVLRAAGADSQKVLSAVFYIANILGLWLSRMCAARCSHSTSSLPRAKILENALSLSCLYIANSKCTRALTFENGCSHSISSRPRARTRCTWTTALSPTCIRCQVRERWKLTNTYIWTAGEWRPECILLKKKKLQVHGAFRRTRAHGRPFSGGRLKFWKVLFMCLYAVNVAGHWLFRMWQAKMTLTGYVPSDLTFNKKPVITSVWWVNMEKEGRDPKMWTAWCMKFMELMGMYCLYPNLEQKRAFISSWNEQAQILKSALASAFA